MPDWLVYALFAVGGLVVGLTIGVIVISYMLDGLAKAIARGLGW